MSHSIEAKRRLLVHVPLGDDGQGPALPAVEVGEALDLGEPSRVSISERAVSKRGVASLVVMEWSRCHRGG